MNQPLLFVFSDLGLGGVQTKLISLSNELSNRNRKCWIFLQTRDGFSRAKELDTKVKIICPLDIAIFGKHPFWGWRFGVFIAVASLFIRPKSILVSLAPLSVSIIKTLNYIAPWMLKRVIVNEDTYPSLYYRSGHVTHVSIKDIKLWYPKVRAVIGVSRSTYIDLKKNFRIPSPPLVYIPNWISGIKRTPGNYKRKTIDIVYAGRLARQKQPYVLARVFSQVLKSRPRTIIHVYADGPMKQEFLLELAQLKIVGKIKFYNPIQNMTDILCQTKCLLFTSEFEGMPFIGLEAMEYGAVVAGLNVPGVRDIATDGETGILTESQDELSYKVIQLLSDTTMRNTLAQNAQKRVHQEFSEKNRDMLIDLLLHTET